MTAPAFGFAARPATITITLEPFARWLPQLAEAAAIASDIAPTDLRRKRTHNRKVSAARHAFAHAARTVLGKSYPEIAEYMGIRHHSAVMTACRTALSRREIDPEFRQLSDLIVAIAQQLVRREPPQLQIQKEMFHDAQAA